MFSCFYRFSYIRASLRIKILFIKIINDDFGFYENEIECKKDLIYQNHDFNFGELFLKNQSHDCGEIILLIIIISQHHGYHRIMTAKIIILIIRAARGRAG